jgi:amino acid transporter
MIGWGWVVLVGNWVVSAGSMGAMLAFAIGGTAVIFIGLTYAELAAAMPLTGGEHVYSYRALGVDASFVCTWAIVLGYVSVVAFEAVALPTVLDHLIPGYQWGYLWTVAGWDVYFTWAKVGILGSILMTWINIRGIQTAAVFQAVVTVVILIGGGLLMIGGVSLGESANLQPLFVDGAKGLLAVLIMTPFMFVGFDVIPQAAEEINLPYKQIGKLLIFSVGLAVF